MLQITAETIQALVAHGEQEKPNEACGYLAAGDGIVVSHFPLTNVDHAHDHFTMDPREQFACVKEIRRRGLMVSGVYHSHPETPARPSAEDIRLAFDPTISYVIVTLLPDQERVRSFRITNGKVEEEKVIVVASPSKGKGVARRIS